MVLNSEGKFQRCDRLKTLAVGAEDGLAELQADIRHFEDAACAGLETFTRLAEQVQQLGQSLTEAFRTETLQRADQWVLDEMSGPSQLNIHADTRGMWKSELLRPHQLYLDFGIPSKHFTGCLRSLLSRMPQDTTYSTVKVALDNVRQVRPGRSERSKWKPGHVQEAEALLAAQGIVIKPRPEPAIREKVTAKPDVPVAQQHDEQTVPQQPDSSTPNNAAARPGQPALPNQPASAPPRLVTNESQIGEHLGTSVPPTVEHDVLLQENLNPETATVVSPMNVSDNITLRAHKSSQVPKAEPKLDAPSHDSMSAGAKPSAQSEKVLDFPVHDMPCSPCSTTGRVDSPQSVEQGRRHPVESPLHFDTIDNSEFDDSCGFAFDSVYSPSPNQSPCPKFTAQQPHASSHDGVDVQAPRKRKQLYLNKVHETPGRSSAKKPKLGSDKTERNHIVVEDDEPVPIVCAQSKACANDAGGHCVRTLEPEGWLNDDVLTYVFRCFTPNDDDWFVMDTAALHVHVGTHQPTVRRIRGLQSQNLVVPLHVSGNHWAVAVVLRDDAVVRIYDPLCSPDTFEMCKTSLQQQLITYLDEKDGTDDREWTYHRDQQWKQGDQFNCGILCLVYGIHKMNGNNLPPKINANAWRRLFHAMLVEYCGLKASHYPKVPLTEILATGLRPPPLHINETLTTRHGAIDIARKLRLFYNRLVFDERNAIDELNKETLIMKDICARQYASTLRTLEAAALSVRRMGLSLSNIKQSPNLKALRMATKVLQSDVEFLTRRGLELKDEQVEQSDDSHGAFDLPTRV